MKRCLNCNTLVDDENRFCSSCGSQNLEAMPLSPVVPTELPVNGHTAAVPAGNGNVVAGIVGALLFSIAGGVLYFLIYQMGFLAGIVGLVTFILASFGYDLFSRSKGSVLGVIISAVVAVIALFAAEYLCVSYEIYVIYKTEFDITFFDAVQATPEFMKDPELVGAMAYDLGMSYLFGAVAVISNLVSSAKAKKKAQ